jgi:hypothetical protein
MATTTRPTRIGLQDQPQAPAGTATRPTVTGIPEQREARSASQRRLPVWAWVASAFLVALVIAAVVTGLHALTTSPAAPTTQSVTAGSVASDPTGIVHGTAGHLVDGSGAPVVVTGSTPATGSTPVRQQPAIRGHLPSSHVTSHAFIAHTMGFVAGRGSM